MTTLEVGKRLVELCKQDKNMQAVNELYDPNIETIESRGDEKMPRKAKGIENVRKKHEWWYASVETHGGTVDGPFFNGDDRFAVVFSLDITMKETKKRVPMKEVAVYTVAGGKIVKEEFFNEAGGQG